MIYTSTAFGATDEYGVSHPDADRLYVFSPYYIEVTGTAANQDITVTVNGISLIRQTNASNKARFPISRLLQTFWSGVDLGEVEFMEGDPNFANTKSKLVEVEKDIVIQVGTDTENKGTITYDLIWGALQVNQIESTIQTILWAWRMPEYFVDLTITDNISAYSKGKDIWLSEWLNTQVELPASYVLLNSFDEPVKTYVFRYMPYCAGGVLLRWIGLDGEYKYYYFKLAAQYQESAETTKVKQNVWTFSEDIYTKSPESAYSKKLYQVYECGIPSADYETQIHMQSLYNSIKQYVIFDPENNGVYSECEIEMEPVVIDRNRLNKEINIKVKFPIYTQSL